MNIQGNAGTWESESKLTRVYKCITFLSLLDLISNEEAKDILEEADEMEKELNKEEEP
jgi:hypothetical protein